jgi:hypothetical protein
LTPKSWEPYFRTARVLVEDLDACKSARAKTVKIGLFFGRNVGREVPIEDKGRTGKAVLRVDEGRARERRYYFEVMWDDEASTKTGSELTMTSEKSTELTQKKATTNTAAAKKSHDNKSTAEAKRTGAAKAKTGRKHGAKRKTGNDEDW